MSKDQFQFGETLHVLAYYDPSYLGYSLYVTTRDHGENVCRVLNAKSGEWEKVAEATWSKPTLILEPEQAQELLECLWKAGLRPSEGVPSEGQKEALQNHVNSLENILSRVMGKIE